MPIDYSRYPPEPPLAPLSRCIRRGVSHFCKNCHSTMPRSGFLGLFGERLCDNENCENSKSKNRYYKL